MEAFHKYFDLLELPPEAGIEAIHRNYAYLRALYSGEAIELTALHGDFSPELRQDYLSRLDDAHEKLTLLLENQKPIVTPPTARMDADVRAWIEDIAGFSGAALKSIRERMNVELDDMFSITRIQPQYLDAIENECFDSFPAEVYLRSYLIEYTRFLQLDTRKVLDDYMPRYRAWAGTRRPAPPAPE
ncbi:MAG TPA: helix-turn-helix domain-containing protein [Desulfuromonadaceae bacterium]